MHSNNNCIRLDVNNIVDLFTKNTLNIRVFYLVVVLHDNGTSEKCNGTLWICPPQTLSLLPDYAVFYTRGYFICMHTFLLVQFIVAHVSNNQISSLNAFEIQPCLWGGVCQEQTCGTFSQEDKRYLVWIVLWSRKDKSHTEKYQRGGLLETPFISYIFIALCC